MRFGMFSLFVLGLALPDEKRHECSPLLKSKLTPHKTSQHYMYMCTLLFFKSRLNLLRTLNKKTLERSAFGGAV